MVGEDAIPQRWTGRDKAEPVDWEAVYREEMPRIYNLPPDLIKIAESMR